jgi:hypothetical protein
MHRAVLRRPSNKKRLSIKARSTLKPSSRATASPSFTKSPMASKDGQFYTGSDLLTGALSASDTLVTECPLLVQSGILKFARTSIGAHNEHFLHHRRRGRNPRDCRHPRTTCLNKRAIRLSSCGPFKSRLTAFVTSAGLLAAVILCAINALRRLDNKPVHLSLASRWILECNVMPNGPPAGNYSFPIKDPVSFEA